MDKKVFSALEYDKIAARIAAHTVSERGKAAILSMEPADNSETARVLLQKTAEADRIMYEFNVFPSFGIDDITDSLMLAEKQSMLSIPELLKVARVLRVSRVVKNSIIKLNAEIPHIRDYAKEIFIANELEENISSAIINESELSDNASPALYAVRRAIRKANERLREKLNSYITSPEYSKYLQDNIVTQRGDRYVIPVKSEARSSVKGLIHDQSASGQTVYIEPLAVVEMNNELKVLKLDEEREIERILREFTSRVGLDAKKIAANCDIITELDIIFAKAVYSREIRAKLPIINDKCIIDIKKGRHPLIDKDKVVPITIRLGSDFDILLITGPNTGGKTVTLKLTGLLVLMALSGLFIPAEEGSEIGFFTQIFSDIGDEQSIEQNLSTFSSHVKNIVSILERLDNKTLVLLDELGAGTDPEEGAALAVSITDYLLRKNIPAVITTHYSLLKEYSYTTERVENACMDFNPDTYEPTYKLIIGVPGTSNALEIARKLGLKAEIIQRAEGNLTAEKISFEEVLQSADMTRRRAEDELENYKRLSADLEAEIKQLKQEKNALSVTREKLNLNAKREVKRMVDNALTEVNEIIAELKNILDNPTDGSYFEAAKLRKRIEEINLEEEDEIDMPSLSEEPPAEGDRVYVDTIHDTAILDKITKSGEYIVRIGNIKTTVKRKDIKKLKRQEDNSIAAPAKPEKSPRGLQNEKIVREINLLGQTVDEAIYNLSRFIDDSTLNGVDEIKVIHGMGTGRLKLGILSYLNGANVVSYREGGYGEGSRGVTVVRLK